MNYLDEIVKFDQNGTVILAQNNQSQDRFHSLCGCFHVLWRFLSHFYTFFNLGKLRMGVCSSLPTHPCPPHMQILPPLTQRGLLEGRGRLMSRRRGRSELKQKMSPSSSDTPQTPDFLPRVCISLQTFMLGFVLWSRFWPLPISSASCHTTFPFSLFSSRVCFLRVPWACQALFSLGFFEFTIPLD